MSGENYTEKVKKEECTMAVITKPNQQAFVLSSDKASEFLTQDNSKFKKLVAKFEKFNNSKNHSASDKIWCTSMVKK